jgi:DNA-binding MarR family transcriptional regulator
VSSETENLAVTLFSEMLAADQLARTRLSKVLPKGMELSHFSILNHLAHLKEERTPAQLAHTFNVTRGAITNTLGKLEWAGYIHIRPDWDDARRKLVAISPAGVKARDAAITSMMPMIVRMIEGIGNAKARATIPVLREMRKQLSQPE